MEKENIRRNIRNVRLQEKIHELTFKNTEKN